MARKQLVLSRNADPKTLNAEQRRYMREDLGFINKTSSEWVSENPVLGDGEQGYDKDRKAFKIGDGSTAWNSLPYIVNGETQTALNAAERLSGNTPAGTYVEQTDVPNVIFFQTGADASDAASWVALPASKEADGSFVVDMTLANVTGTVPDLNQWGVSGGVPSIGDGITANGRKVTMNTKPAGMAYAVATGDSGDTARVDVKTTTGNAAIRWWDGTVELGGDGSGDGVDDVIIFTKTIPADGNPWSGPSPKDIYVWSCTDAASPTDPTQVGDITYLVYWSGNNLTTLDASGLTALTKLGCSANKLTTLDVSGLTALTELYCTSNNLTTLDVSGLTALTELRCNDNNLTTLDASGLTALTYLRCNDNNLTTLDVSGLTALTELRCYDNNLTTLDVSGLTALTYLGCYNNNLSTLDVSGLTALIQLRAQNNSLTQVIADGWDGALYITYHGDVYPDFENNLLTTDAVYEMLDAAATADPPTSLLLDGNPCEENDVLQDGTTYTAAQLTALADSKSYSLILN